jgi:hypothetical protein
MRLLSSLHSYFGIPREEALKDVGKECREKEGLKGGVVRIVFLAAAITPEG